MRLSLPSPDNPRPFILNYAPARPPDRKLPDAGSIGHFGRAAFYTSLLVMIGEAILAAYGGADPAAIVCCVYVVFGAVMAGVGLAIAAWTVAARHVLLQNDARMRNRSACVGAGVLYPITVVAISHILALVQVDPVSPLVATLGVVALIVLPAVGAGWWMVRRKSATGTH